jgi:hypothetical protein
MSRASATPNPGDVVIQAGSPTSYVALTGVTFRAG